MNKIICNWLYHLLTFFFHQLPVGNKPLLPLFNTNLKGDSPSKRGARSGKKDADAGNMIMYKGSMLDIPSMVGRVEKSEKLKRETDTKLKDLQEEMGT